jgi:Tfp pilus assembly protein PilN
VIRINLLPPEKRRPERTPLPRFLMILVAAATTAGVVMLILILLFRMWQLDGEIKTQNDLKQALAPIEKEYDAAEKEINEVKGREDLVKALEDRGVYWSEVINHLWTILDADKSVFITGITILDGQKAKSLIKGTSTQATYQFGLQIGVKMLSDDTNQATDLRRTLNTDPYLAQYLPMIDPIQEIVYTTKDGVPMMEFNIAMVAPVVKTPPKGAPGKAAPGAPTAGAK